MMHRLWIFLLAFIIQAPILHSQDTRRYLFGDEFKRSVRFDFSRVQNFIILDIKLENILPSKFIFDTGSEYTIIIKKELAYLLNMDYFKSIPLYGSDLSKQVFAFISRNADLNIEDELLIRTNVLVLEQDFLHLDEMLGMQIDGILGANVFNRYVLHINNRRNYIEFIKKQYFSPGKDYHKIPITINKSKPYLTTKVRSGGDVDQYLKFLIDSGSAIPLLIYNNTMEHLELPETLVPGNLGVGLGGTLTGHMGKIDHFEFGQYEFKNMITSFQELDIDSIGHLYLNRNGLIGNSLLSRFDVYIDYPGSMLYIKPNKDYNDRFRVDRSGLILIGTGPDFSRILVQKVVAGSPADEAGIKAGDVIRRINFWPSFFYSLQSINYKLSGKIGKKIKLTLRRNGEKVKAEFRLKSLFEPEALEEIKIK